MTAPTAEIIARMRPAVSAGWYYVPYEAVGDDNALAQLKRTLTHKSRNSGKVIRMYKDLSGQRVIGVPRAYGQIRWNWLPVVDEMSDGVPFLAPVPRRPSPNHPAVKEPVLQAKFMREIKAATTEHFNFIAYATTGSGKTVVALDNAAEHGRKTAILVPLERLMDQWIDEIMEKLGVPRERIGICQSDRCEWEDKDFVVCMMKSLGQRQYPQEFYQSFGQIYVDEAHRLGTAELAIVTAKFPARVRIGLSATPERSDGSDRVIFWHIGPIKVRSEATAIRCEVYPMVYDDNGRMAAIPPLKKSEDSPKKVSDHGYRIKKLTEDEQRNRKLAEMVVRLWRARDPAFGVLAIGEHVSHIQRIMEICESMGVPRSVMGQCTAERHTYKTAVVKGKLVKRLVSRTKVSRDEFNRAKENAEIVFATYGCFKEGIDEPRLAYGIDLTPTSKAKQVIGRVRRPYLHKSASRWITPVDKGDWMSMRYWQSRLRDYRADSEVRLIDARL